MPPSTGIHIQPLALWKGELQPPELFSNPSLTEAIKRDGVRAELLTTTR